MDLLIGGACGCLSINLMLLLLLLRLNEIDAACFVIYTHSNSEHSTPRRTTTHNNATTMMTP
jgi:hypothetical protein